MTEEKDRGSRATRALSGLAQGLHSNAILAGINIGLLPVMPYIRKQVSTPEERTVKEFVALADRLGTAAGIPENPPPGSRPIGIDSAAWEKPPGTSSFKYRHKNKNTGELADMISVSRRAPTTSIAHEVGHAAAPNKLEQAIRYLGIKTRNPYLTPVPALMALSGALSDETPVQTKAAPWVGGGMLAAILAEETRANARAIKALTATGHAMSPVAKAKMFLPTATYLVSRGPLLVGAPLGIMAGLNYYNKLRDEGRAPKARDLLHASPKALTTLPTKEQLKEKWQSHLG